MLTSLLCPPSLGLPGEVYLRGLFLPVTLLVGVTFGLVLVPNLFIPIFYKMRLTSVFEVGAQENIIS